MISSSPGEKVTHRGTQTGGSATSMAAGDIEFRHLLGKARDAKNGGHGAWAVQSTGEKLAVALVLNRPEWIASMDYSLADAIERVGAEWLQLIPRVAKALLHTEDGPVAQTQSGCDWSEDEDGYWRTTCGKAFVMFNGKPSENDFTFCPHCSKPMLEHPYNIETSGALVDLSKRC